MTRAILLAAALAAAPLAAHGADVFSPGDLSRTHAALSGLENCTRCHPAGEQLSQQRCLDCHRELAGRVSAGEGLHGRMKGDARDCWKCHHEHAGRDAPLVEWPGGAEARFDHAQTGTALGGAHARVACAGCHAPRLVRDPAAKAVAARRRTFLGAPALTACAACHDDPHKGQLGADCRRCHADAGWKPAAGFDHARTAFPLTGKHLQVACQKCHLRESPDAPLRFAPVPHATCTDCHRDPHEQRFGDACARCHTTEDWRRVSAAGEAERAFHDRTRYPLQGAHRSVACAACHGPFPGEPARFRGLAFGACTDCHADAHVGQLARHGPAQGACDRCHDVNGYQPPRFGLDAHQRARFRLEGAHRAVPCAACHRRDPALEQRFPATLRAELARRGRPARVSLAAYDVAGDLGRCETCHADPHGGQLRRPEGCAACHGLDSFRAVRFDHGRDSRFPLAGRHAAAACAACHAPAGAPARYQLPLACAGCHADPHAAQLGDDCARCHAAERWEPTLFRHAPPFTDYALTGKHARLACERCHAPVEVARGVRVRRYRPLPRACEGCHVDFHRGAFRGFEPGEGKP